MLDLKERPARLGETKFLRTTRRTGRVMKGPTGSFKESLVAGLVMLALVVGLQSAVADEAVQCPSGGEKFDQSGNVDGVSFEASGSSLTMTNTTTSEMATVLWCAEGEEELSNGSKISGVVSTSIPGGQSRSSSFEHDISHFIIYGVEHQESGGPQPPPGNGNGGGGDGDGGGDGGGDNGGAPSKGGGRPGASGAAAPPPAVGAVAPPPPAIVDQPTVTG
jgi:hypothetical protein